MERIQGGHLFVESTIGHTHLRKGKMIVRERWRSKLIEVSMGPE